MRIKLHSHYHHFQNHEPIDGEPYIECFNDVFVKEKIPENSIALLIEPRPLQPKVYEYVEENYNKFKYIFTHDSILLDKLPNAKLIIWGGVWDWNDIEKDFSHPISMVASQKEEAPVRIQRKHLAIELKDIIDCYGTFDGGEVASTYEIYAKYPFSVVIENHIDDWWITEKICNCFSNKTIPIYYGARNIDQLFNKDGIIHCDSIENVRYMVNILLGKRAEQSYNERLDAINDNYCKVKNYANFETWFYKEYGGLLDEMVNNNTVL